MVNPTKQTSVWFKRRCICLVHFPYMAWAWEMLLDAPKGSRNSLAVEGVSFSCSEHEHAGTCSSLLCASLGSRHSSGHLPCHGPCHLSLVMLNCESSQCRKSPNWICLALTKPSRLHFSSFHLILTTSSKVSE